ncbi:adenylyl cyclase (plasmid) [Deinococcus sp. KNUC1210]|uniref:adenylyl cyclase n=1 Tax=Deinococcus sp. KNUC1210 TaxID=2917691 RepID=UPI001EF02F9E|nr:adenylyl cyclase [Deinococcus sp. KNUC1210]ULH13839.1 adenylyl cyclase [Deinococcus sp. KNUC1210]
MSADGQASSPLAAVWQRVYESRTRSSGSALAVSAALTLLLAACGQQAQSPTPAGSSLAALSVQKSRVTDLGPNVKVFDPSMATADIQAAVDAVSNQQLTNQFGPQRYTLLFKPGIYGSAEHPLIIQVGYYTEVAGLGASPTDVVINGHVDAYNQCDANGCIALNNFWRSVSNLTINVKGLAGCQSSANFWAVSQASPMRRVNVTGGNLSLMDYCSAGPQYASGGFIADSQTGFVINGSQQQFLVRNSNIGGWSNGVWNQVFAGVVGAPPQSFGGSDPYTTLAQNPASREKPYLYQDASGRYQVFVPDAKTNGQGATWLSGQTPGHSISIDDFYVARPSDSAQTLNNQLAQGNNLLLTPGVYNISSTLKIKRANTVVLGMGVATIVPQNGVVAMSVADVQGVDIAGLMFDAGPVNSPVLLQVGTHQERDEHAKSERHDGSFGTPTALQDVFFRIGGAQAGKATLSLEVNTDNTILDDIWAWRADHGEGVGWTVNTADTGLVVNGDNVTATGLFVEHYQKDEVIWNGENGKTIFFQNEMPYDAPNQAAWKHGSVLGYAGYLVDNSVKVHEGWGMGSYIFTNVDPTIHASHGFEVPNKPGVRMHDLLTVELGAGTIDHVINSTGNAVTSAAIGVPSTVVSYP